MTWFKVDDHFWSHPKTYGLSATAVALWVRSGCYSGDHLTDGVIQRNVLPLVQGTPEQAAELVQAGLWIETVEGWQFHDWCQYQPSREKVETKRQKDKERVQAFRDKNKALLLKEEHPTRPVPTRPLQRTSNAVTKRERQDDENPDFATFWATYPRREGKGAARNAYRKALQNSTVEELQTAVERYANDPNRDPAYTAHASTWLNQERWTDTPLPERKADTGGDKRMARNQRIIAWAADQDAQQHHTALEGP